ncbi:DUF2726 domain-containing protein [Novacetimonas hansenii]|uniref:DUF2726 domain-containing protein n=1 Tax=Novacetimonas hansenii TaxID=436 RepID=UPI000789B36B|nr:DUF2726 domain-containing protein [Novacetimonas hansenii]RFO99761.1 hypothetical protein BGC30_10420 [Novacetimonas hansenii]WEQ58260.1 DUF2726 domain-containing protein [Novacetimonas hansenii]CUW48599.1 hypothetical protein ATCC53582_02738 [Novacetimonas hansenii]
MEKVIILLAIGYAVGFYVRDRRAKEALAQQAAVRQKEDERRRQYRQENDLSDPQNQLRFIDECSLKAVPPVNREAVRVLYAIDEWIKDMQPDWRFAFEVAMGGFIKTPYAPDDPRQKRAFKSYSGKRVDFLLIDRFGNPVLVVEYNGSGHDLSGDADARMAVKRLALQKADIPLLEIPERMGKLDIFAALSEKVGTLETETRTG